MRMSLPGLILSMLLYAVEFLVFPYFVIGCFTAVRSYDMALDETRNFVDAVIDSREVTEQMKSEYFYALASTDIIFAADIYREIMTINPDPVNIGQTITVYTTVEDYSTFNTGDFITVHVRPVSSGPYQAIVRLWLMLPDDMIKIYKSTKVR